MGDVPGQLYCFLPEGMNSFISRRGIVAGSTHSALIPLIFFEDDFTMVHFYYQPHMRVYVVNTASTKKSLWNYIPDRMWTYSQDLPACILDNPEEGL